MVIADHQHQLGIVTVGRRSTRTRRVEDHFTAEGTEDAEVGRFDLGVLGALGG